MYQNNFWDWSLQVYANSATQSACLDLQDTFSQNVNMMLWGCWLGSQGLSPTVEALSALPALGEIWQNSLITGVRKARRNIDTVSYLETAKDLKTAFLALEISLERQEQFALQALSTEKAESALAPSSLCVYNLHHIIKSHSSSAGALNTDLEEALQRLITSIF